LGKKKTSQKKENLILIAPPLSHREAEIVSFPILTTLDLLSLKGYWVSVAFLSQRTIAELSLRYRKKRGPTDILSFPPSRFSPPILFQGKEFLGELLVAPSYVKEIAQRHRIEISPFSTRILVHGTLHLVGYDHHTRPLLRKMQEREEEVLALIPGKIQEAIPPILERIATILEGEPDPVSTLPKSEKDVSP
jgi:probable rRNA maturation factor